MDVHPILSTQKWKRKKLEFKKLHMIKEDVPTDEVNCGEGYWHFFSRRKNTDGIKYVSLAWEF